MLIIHVDLKTILSNSYFDNIYIENEDIQAIPVNSYKTD